MQPGAPGVVVLTLPGIASGRATLIEGVDERTLAASYNFRIGPLSVDQEHGGRAVAGAEEANTTLVRSLSDRKDIIGEDDQKHLAAQADELRAKLDENSPWAQFTERSRSGEVRLR